VITPTRISSQTLTGTVESGAIVTVSVNTAAIAGNGDLSYAGHVVLYDHRFDRGNEYHLCDGSGRGR